MATRSPRYDLPPTEKSDMTAHELGSGTIDKITELTFGQLESQWTAHGGSPWRKFYEQAAATPKRVIAWNTERPFAPNHLFFRSVDTGRLLAMDNAPFRAQIWRSPACRVPVKKYSQILMTMIHEVLLLRNLHDLGAADIPIVLCDLNQTELKQALDYWVWLSKKGNQTSPERAKKFYDIYDACRDNKRYPCFLQLDLTVRKIISTRGNNGLVPPFVIIHSTNTHEDHKPKARILFTRSCAVPRKRLMQFWPNTCGGVECSDPDCELIDMPRKGKEDAWVLHTDGDLVTDTNRQGEKIQGEKFCNHWPCGIKCGPGLKLNKCAKCLEVMYCSREHQREDWQIHRDICGSGPRGVGDAYVPLTATLADGSTKNFDSWYDLYDNASTGKAPAV